ncbi:hypothetical protein C4D60_Mb04t36960 [Musa balbisiana]|uniref:HMA domain-containing protein n=1 Tax=Musa balbisiana TaxID=52838 RepID=A0A4S8KHI9_MUSBA|nr:hypothetical protein C4D60_Mb04t36960 [Musa balbisiana]
MADAMEARPPSAVQKTTFTVLGICCSSEIKLIDRILNHLEGIENVSVNVLAKTATVVHDPAKAPASRIGLMFHRLKPVSALNGAHLNAGIKESGRVQIESRPWPSASVVASGALLLVALCSYVFPPLIWIALLSVTVGVLDMLRRAVAALRRCVLDINVLMVAGQSASISFEGSVTVSNDDDDAVFGAIGLGDYLEAASIVFLFTLAEWLEAKSTNKARVSLESLLNLAPQTAVIAETGETVHVKDIMINTIVVTVAVAEDSAVARMVKLVEDAQNRRSNMEEFIEQFAKYYTPGVFLVAAGTAIIPWILGVHPLRQWIYLALVLLVIACPCALVISTPVAKACGLSAAAKMGLIFKGGNYLEALAKVKAMAFDKTGTLTEGAFEVVEVQCWEPNANIGQFLHWISSLENMSSHPMARALVEYARVRGVKPSSEVRNFNLIPGGIAGFVDDCYVKIGNAEVALSNGWLRENELRDNEAGITISYVGMVDRCIGYFCLGDQLREEAARAVQELKKQQIHVIVLTGDSKAAAEHVQKQIGENVQVEAGLSPEGKMKKIAELKETWGLTAMVGDGINDAPALTESDVGVAMGISGSALATETANVALMSNDLRRIPEAVELARSSLRKIYQNVAMSLAVKLLFFGLAFGGLPSLWAAVVADMGTCLLVIFNSMHLLHKYGGRESSTSSSQVPQEQSINVDEFSEPLLSSERRDQDEEAPCLCCKGRSSQRER